MYDPIITHTPFTILSLYSHIVLFVNYKICFVVPPTFPCFTWMICCGVYKYPNSLQQHLHLIPFYLVKHCKYYKQSTQLFLSVPFEANTSFMTLLFIFLHFFFHIYSVNINTMYSNRRYKVTLPWRYVNHDRTYHQICCTRHVLHWNIFRSWVPQVKAGRWPWPGSTLPQSCTGLLVYSPCITFLHVAVHVDVAKPIPNLSIPLYKLLYIPKPGTFLYSSYPFYDNQCYSKRYHPRFL